MRRRGLGGWLLLFLVALECGAADRAGQIDELMALHIKDSTPGAAVLVVHDGKKVFEKGYGLADIAKNVAISPRTNFELASCSKQFTAMAIMILAERKKLHYSDTLGMFFPEFHPAAQAITIEQILHHTSGLPDYFDAWSNSKSEAIPTSRLMLELIAKNPKLVFKPGAKYEYSNSGYMVLAQIVEKVSKKRFAEFMKENVFEPLGMTNTVVYDETHPKILHRANCYSHLKSGEFKNTAHDDLNNVYGDGSVRSTIEDLYKWDQALYTEKLVSAATLKRAWTEGKTNSGEGIGYGYGWEVGTFRKVQQVCHSGLWLDFNNEVVRIPEKQLTVIVLSNLGKFDADGVAHKIAGMYLRDE